jgi:hypothetical protein
MAYVEVSSREGRAWLYSPRVQLELLDQTDLKNGVNAILGGGGGSFWKLTSRGHYAGLGATMVGPAIPTWQPLMVRRGVVSSGII